jgi:phage shock protein A
MALSDQLGRLSTRAQEAQKRAADAHAKAREDLADDVDAARATSRAAAEKLSENASTSDAWSAAHDTWNRYVSAVHRTIDEANDEVNLAQARATADAAENDASYAIDYAYATIEQAEYAALHAEYMRQKANQLETGAHAPA